mmetsp:Transcript_1792/g.2582  ORF Transcript_1792/g.2582 Transcript_1792/m.2582 type:complete len:321 (-) Transcript_1792:466-1428(-)|eukprot:CAMPEP_0184868868 /NCGR_PEP_ID=MMETSP0580-20130426/31995_1 /TAXON_ID=1118495 /ORGANISM="Dactyliosolen fragilissimus" /LENGTH=320 /DNA_ID=CAMNT_0027370019 /DNA_START=24 /DNA_END=986 /DNA_ORIENTATION=-
MRGTIKSIVAKVFQSHGHQAGGNPVSVFLLGQETVPSQKVLQHLARSCEWESVVALLPAKETAHSSENEKIDPTLLFFMPSGEEVSFCAHAAMGAVVAISREFEIGIDTDNDFLLRDGTKKHVKLRGNEAELSMGTCFEEKVADQAVVEKLLEQIGLKYSDLDIDSTTPMINSSVARHKTLIPISSLEKLAIAKDPRNPQIFMHLCDEIKSTGIYLYRRIDNPTDSLVPSFECRQFPRASGYPEDPATGIAASALARSLQKRNVFKQNKSFAFYQGRSMGRLSKINVRCQISSNGHVENLFCSGLVHIDMIKNIMVPSLS